MLVDGVRRARGDETVFRAGPTQACRLLTGNYFSKLSAVRPYCEVVGVLLHDSTWTCIFDCYEGSLAEAAPEFAVLVQSDTSAPSDVRWHRRLVSGRVISARIAPILPSRLLLFGARSNELCRLAARGTSHNQT